MTVLLVISLILAPDAASINVKIDLLVAKGEGKLNVTIPVPWANLIGRCS